MPLICRVVVFIMLVFFPTQAPGPIMYNNNPFPVTRRHHYATHEMLYIQLPLLTVNVLIFVVTFTHAVIRSACKISHNLKDSLNLIIEHQFYCYAIMVALSFATYTQNINDTSFLFTMSAYHALNTVCVFFETRNDMRHGGRNTNSHSRQQYTTHNKYSTFEFCLYIAALFTTLQIIHYYVPNDINYMHHIVGFTLPEITTIALKSVFTGVRIVIK